MTDVDRLRTQLTERLAEWIDAVQVAYGEVTVEVKTAHLLAVCRVLYDEALFDYQQLVDLCGVDYLDYGLADWQTTSTTATGFSRGVSPYSQREATAKCTRFAVVYHLLSLTNNHRLRLRVPVPDHDLLIDSVMTIWPSANWYEREAFDLFGILFKGHPDLRRILTDYGFIGHPFRKDFPLIGQVEARYDATLRRVIYEPVSIQARVLEPKVIRHDSRYLDEENQS